MELMVKIKQYWTTVSGEPELGDFADYVLGVITSRDKAAREEAEFFMGSHISTLMMPLLVHRLEKDFPSMTKEVIEEVHNKVRDYMKPFMEKREAALHSTNTKPLEPKEER